MTTMGIFKTLVTFLIGAYAGIYADQRYEIPKVPDPVAVWDTIVQKVEEYKKDDGRDR